MKAPVPKASTNQQSVDDAFIDAQTSAIVVASGEQGISKIAREEQGGNGKARLSGR